VAFMAASASRLALVQLGLVRRELRQRLFRLAEFVFQLGDGLVLGGPLGVILLLELLDLVAELFGAGLLVAN